MSAVKFNAHFSSVKSSQNETETALVGETKGSVKGTKLEYVVTENVVRIGGNPREEEKELFIKNYEFIWENRERIINDGALHEIPLYFAGLSLAYMSGGALTLGMLLTLWNNGEWTTKCPFCGGAVRIFGRSGSPLTGRNRYHGFCTSCGKYRSDAEDDFMKKIRSAINMINARKARYAKEHPRAAPPKVAHHDFRTLSEKWTEYQKDPKKIPVTKPEKSVPEESETKIWFSPVQTLIDNLNNVELQSAQKFNEEGKR